MGTVFLRYNYLILREIARRKVSPRQTHSNSFETSESMPMFCGIKLIAWNKWKSRGNGRRGIVLSGSCQGPLFRNSHLSLCFHLLSQVQSAISPVLVRGILPKYILVLARVQIQFTQLSQHCHCRLIALSMTHLFFFVFFFIFLVVCLNSNNLFDWNDHGL